MNYIIKWNQKNFIENLKWLRKMNHLTQEQLALKVGVSRESVTKWETERIGVSIENVVRLATVFDVSVDELLGIKQSKDLSLLDLLSYCRRNGITVIYNGSIASATFIDGNGNVKRQLQRYKSMIEESVGEYAFNDEEKKFAIDMFELLEEYLDDKYDNINFLESDYRAGYNQALEDIHGFYLDLVNEELSVQDMYDEYSRH